MGYPAAPRTGYGRSAARGALNAGLARTHDDAPDTLAKLRVPLGGQEIELQQIDFTDRAPAA